MLVPKELMGPQTAWGDETNGIRAGMNWEPFGRGNSKVSESVQIVLLTSKTNTGFNYVAPPDKKFTKLELRDAQGVLLTPLNGKRLDGELPKRILTKDCKRQPGCI